MREERAAKVNYDILKLSVYVLSKDREIINTKIPKRR